LKWPTTSTPLSRRGWTGSVEVTRPQEIELYARMFDHLKAPALYGSAARVLIIKALGELG
jgi:hypothetical protein